MKRHIRFFVSGDPQGQPRTKASSRGGFVRCYTPLTVKGSDGKRRTHPAVTWKAQIAKAWACSAPDWKPIEGPVSLVLTFCIPRPKSHFRANGMLKATAPRFCKAKPDFDNLAKAVADQLTTCGVWLDDKQVVAHDFVKLYAHHGEAAGCEITIKELYD